MSKKKKQAKVKIKPRPLTKREKARQALISPLEREKRAEMRKWWKGDFKSVREGSIVRTVNAIQPRKSTARIK